MTAAVDTFVSILEQGPADCSCVFNPWGDHDERDATPRRRAPAVRRANMAAYIEARRAHARVVLLGEAPSHRWLPLHGHRVLLGNGAGAQARTRRPARARAYQPRCRDQAAARAQRAVIWGEIERAPAGRSRSSSGMLSHGTRISPTTRRSGPCGPSSNRKPKLDEVAQGRRAFDALLSCFARPLAVFAVGKVAQNALRAGRRQKCAGYLRHPAQGGEALSARSSGATWCLVYSCRDAARPRHTGAAPRQGEARAQLRNDAPARAPRMASCCART